MATTPAKPSEKQQRQTVAKSYGFNVAFMNSDPELKKLFAQATADGVEYAWTQDQFTAALQNTNWYKKHSSAWRQADAEALVDPATFKAKTAATKTGLQDMAAKYGAVLSGDELDNLVHKVQYLGWDENQQQNYLSGYVQVAHSGPLKGQYLGDAGTNAAALQKTAAANGYTLTDKQLQQWNQAIAKGDTTVDNYQSFMRRQAALTFPSFSDELLAGSDMNQVAQPYFQSMANTLELNPETLTLKDPTIRKALATTDPKTGKPTAMGVGDFETSLRKDPRWMKTDDAHNQIVGTGVNLLRNFGFAV